jgi:outer membrane protein assembly factor BamB
VYVQTSYGIHGLAPGDGRERWRISLGDELEDDEMLQEPGGLALTDGRVVTSYARPDRLLYGVQRYDDELAVDRTTLPVQYPSQPLVIGTGTTALGSGVIWSTDATGMLAAGAAGTSTVKWEFQGMASTGAAAFSTLASDGTRVFVCEGHEMTGEFVVFALRADTGGLEWLYRESIPENGIDLSSDMDFRVAHPAVASDTLLVGYGTSAERGGSTGTMVALSTTAGTRQWRTGLSIAPRDIAPTEAGIFIGGRRGGLSGLTQS